MSKNITEKHVMLGYISAIIAAILFGSVSTIAKPALETIHPLLLSSLVYILAAAVSTPFARDPIKSLERKDWILLLIVAICGAVLGPALFFIGLEQTFASDGALLANGEILFSVIIALFLFGERLGRKGSIAALMIFLSILIITTNLNFLENQKLFHTGNLLIVFATIFWAIDNNLSRILSEKIQSSRIIQIKSGIGGVILFGIVIVTQIPINLDYTNIPNIVLLGTLGFGVSLCLFLYALKKIGTIRTVMLFSTSSAFGLLFAFVLLGEEISITQIIALVIMIGGVYLLQRDETK